jgi:hypothetical protein
MLWIWIMLWALGIASMVFAVALRLAKRGSVVAAVLGILGVVFILVAVISGMHRDERHQGIRIDVAQSRTES